MGFNNTTTSVNLVAKLTPLGRQRLVSTNNALITSFSLGDSDANYYASLPLNSGEVPSLCGNVGPVNVSGNSVTTNVNLRSFLVVNANGITKKSVEPQSINIITETISNGQTTTTNSDLTKIIIDRNNLSTDSYVNLFYSFGLPLNTTNDYTYTGITYANGGYSDTAYSGLAQSKILVIGIDNSKYGEMIDGKTVKIELPTTGGTYNIYSTFQNKNDLLTNEDVHNNDTSPNATQINNNIAFLFSDDILKPNGGNSSLSWATGYDTYKPFSLNNKQLFNFQTNSNLALTADTIVGIAYLDKGIVVITDPTIVNNFGDVTTTGITTGTTVSFNSISTAIYQNITCIASRGEFGSSTNTTIGALDNPRISEVGLYDNLNNLIAIAKTDRHIVKNINEFLALGIKIEI